MRILNPRLARRVARKHAPFIYQRFKSIYDHIVPIHLGDFDPFLIEKPTVYYVIHYDRDFYYCLYCFFHRKDWSTLPWPIKSLDEHEYDFEGVLMVYPRKGETWAMSWGASVYHHALRFTSCQFDTPTIEAGGHGVDFLGGRISGGNLITYNPGEYDLVNIGTPAKKKWLKEEIQPVFNANNVRMPWQWNDWRIRRQFGEDTDGMIYRQPDMLRRFARQAGIKV